MKCLKGHTLSSVYYFQLKPTRTMLTIKGYGYCKECKTLIRLEAIQ